MKKIFIALLCAFQFVASAQQQFTAPVPHWSGAPTGTPSTQGARVRYDQTAGKWYFWNGSTWLLQPDGIAQVAGLLPPAYTPGVGQSHFAINAANELYRWRTGTTWDCINCGGVAEPAGQVVYGTGAGTDSDANLTRDAANGDVRILGSNGNLSLRTNDTVGVLTILAPPAKAAIAYTGDQQLPFYLPRHSLPDSGLIQSFGIGRDVFEQPSSSGDNQVVVIGFNVGQGGDVEDLTNPQMTVRYENSYNNAGQQRAYEFHCPQVWYPGGIPARRPYTGYFSNDITNIRGHSSYSNDYMNFQDYATTQQRATWAFGEKIAPYQPYDKGITFYDTAGIHFEKSHPFASGIWGRKVDGTSRIKMLSTDSQDRILLGGYQETSVAAYNRFNITNSGVLWNENGVIQVGDNTNKTRINVLAAGEEVQMWGRSNAAQSALVLRLDGPSTAPTLASFASYTNNKYPLRFDLRAPNNAWYIDQAGNLASGTDSPNGKLQLIATTGATTKMLNLQNTTGNSVVFRSNASPESAITASPGDITLTNESGAGKVYVKRTGTGNTGHSELQQKADAYVPLQKTDAAATNGELYYSTTQSKLCYKDPSGTVNPLY